MKLEHADQADSSSLVFNLGARLKKGCVVDSEIPLAPTPLTLPVPSLAPEPGPSQDQPGAYCTAPDQNPETQIASLALPTEVSSQPVTAEVQQTEVSSRWL